MGVGGCRAIKFRTVNLAETSTLNNMYTNLFAQVSDIGPSWSSCFINVDPDQTMRHLIWVYTICQCPFYGTLSLNG